MATSLVLASASPRRRDLLASQGLPFEVLPADVPEVPREGETPLDFTCRVAAEKAAAVAALRPGSLVLAADTSVVFGGRALGKPADEREACAMLRTLSGEAHEVITAVQLLGPGGSDRLAVRTVVRFRVLAEEEIRRYVATGEPMDKAGAYGIQGGGAAFVESIFGSYTNVVGLPLAETLAALRRAGIPLAEER